MITSFKGKYAFLDLSAHCTVEYEGVLYNSAEIAFIASQYDNLYLRAQFNSAALPIYKARELTKRLQKRGDLTPKLALELMQEVVFDKFTRNPHFGELLVATGPQRIVAENNWHEQFWGRCVCNIRPGKYGKKTSCIEPGCNHIGKIHMLVRDRLAVVTLAA
jgi:predicted NAD-dependent protein-ADP-ribosyltransferase YbiA (DUF1768 family)